MMTDPATDAEPAAELETGGRKTFRRIIFTVLRVLVILVIAAAIVYTTVSQWADVRDTFRSLAWQSVLLSLAMALIGIFAGMMAWRSAVADLGHPVGLVSGARIALVGQLGKYVPGSVWAYLLQMELGRRAGLPRSRAFLASTVTAGLTITTGLLIGTLGLPALFRAAEDSEYAASSRFVLYALIGLLPVALTCAIPPVLNRLVGLFLKIIRRPPLDTPLTPKGVIRTMAWSAGAFTCFGVHLWLLANAQAAPGFGGLVLSVGSLALAMTVSVFAVLAPSGLGVREFILVAALTPYVESTGVALGIALASRMIFTIADVLAAGGAAGASLRYLRRGRAAGATTDVTDENSLSRS